MQSKNWCHLVALTHSIKSWTLHVLKETIMTFWRFWHGSTIINHSLHQKSWYVWILDIDENNTVNCDKAELTGARIQKSLNDQTFASSSFKREDQITNLQSLYSSIRIDKERVAIDPLTIFLRLVVLVDRKPAVKIENCFYYELTPYPTVLFKNGVMRSAKNKSTLKIFC